MGLATGCGAQPLAPAGPGEPAPLGSAPARAPTQGAPPAATAEGTPIPPGPSATEDAPSQARAVAWFADGRSIAIAYGATVRLLDGTSLVETARLTGPLHALGSVAPSADGRRLAAGSDTGEIFLWRLPGGEIDGGWAFDVGPVKELAFSADGARLVSASYAVRVWAVPSGEPVFARPEEDFALSPDGRWLATLGGDGALEIAGMDGSGVRRRIMPPYVEGAGEPFFPVMDAWFCADSRRLVTTYASYSAWYALRLWDAPTGRPLAAGMAFGRMISPLAVAPDCSVIALVDYEGRLKLHGTDDGAERRELGIHAGEDLLAAFAPSGDRLISVATDGSVRLWDLASGRQLAEIRLGER